MRDDAKCGICLRVAANIYIRRMSRHLSAISCHLNRDAIRIRPSALSKQVFWMYADGIGRSGSLSQAIMLHGFRSYGNDKIRSDDSTNSDQRAPAPLRFDDPRVPTRPRFDGRELSEVVLASPVPPLLVDGAFSRAASCPRLRAGCGSRSDARSSVVAARRDVPGVMARVPSGRSFGTR